MIVTVGCYYHIRQTTIVFNHQVIVTVPIGPGLALQSRYSPQVA
jgi:hypothetical protein